MEAARPCTVTAELDTLYALRVMAKQAVMSDTPAPVTSMTLCRRNQSDVDFTEMYYS